VGRGTMIKGVSNLCFNRIKNKQVRCKYGSQKWSKSRIFQSQRFNRVTTLFSSILMWNNNTENCSLTLFWGAVLSFLCRLQYLRYKGKFVAKVFVELLLQSLTKSTFNKLLSRNLVCFASFSSAIMCPTLVYSFWQKWSLCVDFLTL
jgi:hypothetical protein